MNTKKATWPAKLFGWIFVIAGFLPIGFAAYSVLGYFQSESWMPVRAQMHSLELVEHEGDDSTSYSINAEYEYLFNDVKYQGDRASIHGGSDNIGSYWQDLERSLRRDWQRDQLVAWVNPNNPAESVLDRSLRPGLLVFQSVFGLVFIGVGLGVGFFMGRSESPQNQTPAQVATAASGGILSNNRATYWVLMLVGILFLLISLPFVVLALSELEQGNYVLLLVMIFPIVGGFLLRASLKQKQEYFRIGETRFHPDPNPGCIGGQVGGWFEVLQGQFQARPSMRLQCVKRVRTSKNHVSRSVLWEQERRASEENSDNGNQRLRVVFDVPAGLPANNGKGNELMNGSILWELHCEGQLLKSNAAEPIEFERSWHLPVLAGEAHSEWQMPAAEAQQDAADRQAAAEASAAEQIDTQQQDDKLVLESQQGRHKGNAWGLMLFGAIFGGAGLFLFVLALDEGGMLWIMAPIFSLVGFSILGFGLFWLGRGLVTEIEGRKVRIVRSLFGFQVYQRKVTIYDPSQVEVAETLSSTDSSGKQTQYFRVRLKAKSKTLPLAEGIIGREAAEAVQKKILAQLNNS